MVDSPDWTDEALRAIDELARLALPDGGVTGETLRPSSTRASKGRTKVTQPRTLSGPDAAAYLGVSRATFAK